MNVRLLVLGLLEQKPMHGYELRKLAAQNRIESWTGILPGSIYHALGQLAKEGLIISKATERQGDRVREVFAITRAGRAQLKRLVQEAWRERIRSFPTPLYGALSFRSALDPADERTALDTAIHDLEAEVAAWESARPLKGPMTADQEAMYDNGLTHLRTDLALLRHLRRSRNRRSKTLGKSHTG
jgi:DNA-binding PadR family transcriptional regulator